ncbi:MAG: hypothetical protein JXQ30_08785 [Spirochaetes bacterium]|nr:hypothetical protein [Spirochaetota bacterium]
MKKSEKVGKKNENNQAETALKRAEKVWKYIYIEGMTRTAAWKKAFPFTKAKKKNWSTLAKRACELFESEKMDDIEGLLKSSGLGLPRVVQEIHKGLTQKKVIVYQGKVTMDENGNPLELEDNATQQRMREALIRIHGLEKRIVEHSGKDGGPIPIGVVEIPSKKSPEDWNREHGTGDREGMDSAAETEVGP